MLTGLCRADKIAVKHCLAMQWAGEGFWAQLTGCVYYGLFLHGHAQYVKLSLRNSQRVISYKCARTNIVSCAEKTRARSAAKQYNGISAAMNVRVRQQVMNGEPTLPFSKSAILVYCWYAVKLTPS